MKYWLVKSEPFKYSWTQFQKDGSTFWDGVRNYQARNNLRDMKAQPALTDMGLIRQGRLSVVSLTKKEFDTVLKMAGVNPKET